jgi:hypothetical protein
MTAQSGGLTLEIKRVLPAAPSVVFGAFSAPDELAKWCGPEGFTTPSLEFNPRVGDSYRIEMQPPEGDPFYLTGSSARSIRPPASPTRSYGRTQIPTTLRPWSSCRFGILASRRRSSSLRVPSRPRRAASSTGTAGRTVSTSSSDSSRRHSQPPTATLRAHDPAGGARPRSAAEARATGLEPATSGVTGRGCTAL